MYVHLRTIKHQSMNIQEGEDAQLVNEIVAHLQKSSSIDGFADMMIRLLLQTIPGELSLLEHAIQEHQTEKVKLILHRLKPTAKVYGLSALHDLIAQTEESVIQNGLCMNNMAAVDKIMHQFQHVVDLFSNPNM
jgi:HPt (histidine-containing phosphotransfer) domain-containing protein